MVGRRGSAWRPSGTSRPSGTARWTRWTSASLPVLRTPSSVSIAALLGDDPVGTADRGRAWRRPRWSRAVRRMGRRSGRRSASHMSGDCSPTGGAPSGTARSARGGGGRADAGHTRTAVDRHGAPPRPRRASSRAGRHVRIAPTARNRFNRAALASLARAATVHAVPAHPARRPGRRRGAEPQAAGARPATSAGSRRASTRGCRWGWWCWRNVERIVREEMNGDRLAGGAVPGADPAGDLRGRAAGGPTTATRCSGSTTARASTTCSRRPTRSCSPCWSRASTPPTRTIRWRCTRSRPSTATRRGRGPACCAAASSS